MADAHQVFRQTSGSWTDGGATSVDVDAVSPAEHAVRITVDEFDSGGFSGAHNVIVEVDHNASIFAAAERTFSGAIDFDALQTLSVAEGQRFKFKNPFLWGICWGTDSY